MRVFTPFVAGLLVGFFGFWGASAVLTGASDGANVFFTDVEEGAYYDMPVLEMVRKGIVRGYESGDFGPNDPVTRGQVVVMLNRYDEEVVQPLRMQIAKLRELAGAGQCGDGSEDYGEECDDGNANDGDGCSAECLMEERPKPSPLPGGGDCVVGGCSGQLCMGEGGEGEEAISTCEWLEEYGCYRRARCERQANGECNWAQTPELLSCLENKGVIESGVTRLTGCGDGMCVKDEYRTCAEDCGQDKLIFCQDRNDCPEEQFCSVQIDIDDDCLRDPSLSCRKGGDCIDGCFGECICKPIPCKDGTTRKACDAQGNRIDFVQDPCRDGGGRDIQTAPVCGNGICEEGEADRFDHGGCAPCVPNPTMRLSCTNPPSVCEGGCPADCLTPTGESLMARCAFYYRNDVRERPCATCGNGICEAYEDCTPSNCTVQSCTQDCGPLYCPKDCERETP